jgi:hypothetical protein
LADDEVLRAKRSLRAFFFLDNKEDVSMVLIKVQYDAYNRQFKILDRELARTLEDGETYILIADVSIKDLELKQSAEIQPELIPVS